ncbi:DASH complex subunit Dam1-domain-containing protein [Naematelia encephala]|uniref:DASH complex subunit DAM1 n=1 Tax=Naematelia encephala TaxID=71784 RepID=A0A1Y2BJA0_9TREE|nr:DASH complex subunit Dam1-domain-containing protein [Naematelia encephala]
MPPPHPLRRISTGSLSSLARSQDRAPQSSSGLDFLAPALTELADEAATLAANVQHLNELHDALGTFNESFAGWLLALKMNAFCVEWPLGPNEVSFLRAPTLAPPPPPVLSILHNPNTIPSSPTPGQTQSDHPGDMTYATSYSNSTEDQPLPPKKVGTGPGLGVKKGIMKKPPAERKKRELAVSAIIDTLPLEYRGSQPSARLAMEKIINKLMDNPSGLPIKEMVSQPDLPHPRVNKCLIALVSKKAVTKVLVEGSTWYKWVGA